MGTHIERVGDIIVSQNKPLVYPGSTLAQDNQAAKLKEYETKMTAVKQKALNAPIPNIGMADSSLLLRAVPMIQERSKAGIFMINHSNMNDSTIDKMDKLTHLVEFVQEILVVGDTVPEHYPSFKPGMFVRIDETRFIKGRYNAANVENELYYDIPVITIDGYEYLMVSASDIMYYLK